MITYPHTQNMPSRVAASICYSLDCPELVSSSFQDYEERAVNLALNKDTLLRDLRQKVCRNRETTPCFDTALWVKHLEVGLEEAWRIFTETGGFGQSRTRHIDLSHLNQLHY